MNSEPHLSFVASLIGDQTRAAILSALLGGQALPASELAYRAQITAQTTSAHLAKLVDGGLLDVQQTGRHRYYRLKNAEVARALEALAMIAPPIRIKAHHDLSEHQAFYFARSCYDHLAGKLGVAVTQTMLNRRQIVLEDNSYSLTDEGTAWFAGWSIDENQLRKGRRLFARTCLDWSERQNHLAGALGAALLSQLFEKEWVTRIPDSRALHVTQLGQSGFRREFALDVENL